MVEEKRKMKRSTLILLIAFIVLGGIGAFVYWKIDRSHPTNDNPFMQFAIEDTASIGKITIQDRNGEVATLIRLEGTTSWTINKKYPARPDAIQLLLECIHDIRVRGNVPAKAKENMLTVMATSAKEVKIYNLKNELIKTYFVGPNWHDHQGTIMVLETPADGRSEEPYITHIEGFTGFLNPRFFIAENEWRSNAIFNFPKLDIQQVEFINHVNPNQSFRFKVSSSNRIQAEVFANGTYQAFSALDTLLAFDFIKRMCRVNIESYNTYLKPTAADSIKSSAPAFTFIVTDAVGLVHPLHLFLKKANGMKVDGQGNSTPYDPDYFWAKDERNELGLAQYFFFEPLLMPADFYNPTKTFTPESRVTK
jgi:hypothetical protein